jgi:hypothetical protein
MIVEAHEAINISEWIDKVEGKVRVTDFDLSSAYRGFHQDFLSSLKACLKAVGTDHQVIELLLGYYSRESKQIQLDGPGQLLNYHFPGGEIKSVAIRSNVLLVDSLYWVPSYPFLDVVGKEDCERRLLRVAIKKELFDFRQSGGDPNSGIILVSHNNHYGHFLFDDLPRLRLDTSTLSMSKTRLAYEYCESIHQLIGVTLGTNTAQASTIGKANSLNTVTESKRVISSHLTNPVVNIFLLRKIIDNAAMSKSVAGIAERMERIILSRGSSLYSRVYNREEVVSLCRSHGFIEVDPFSFEIGKFISLLYRSSIIISECGSSLLSAAAYSSEQTNLIGLAPADLFSSPPSDMILGGLPYHLTAPMRTRFILGQIVIRHQIMTSSVCKYDISDLRLAIKKIDGSVLNG